MNTLPIPSDTRAASVEETIGYGSDSLCLGSRGFELGLARLRNNCQSSHRRIVLLGGRGGAQRPCKVPFSLPVIDFVVVLRTTIPPRWSTPRRYVLGGVRIWDWAGHSSLHPRWRSRR